VIEALAARVSNVELELTTLRRRERSWKLAAAVLGVAFLWGPSVGHTGGKKQVVVATADDSRVARLAPDGIVFEADGKPRVKLEIGDSFSYWSMYDRHGRVTFQVGSDEMGTALKLYKDEALAVEVAESLIDSGSGVRLYDRQGNPRATLYSGKRGGESGLELTDANHQPRVDIFAQPDGITVLRAGTSAADAQVEMSILPRSDALSRYTGMVPQPEAGEPFVPMLYMHDHTGATKVFTPVDPR
jgi:hypothetical protein